MKVYSNRATMFKYPLKPISQKELHKNAKKLKHYTLKYKFVKTVGDVPRAKVLAQIEANGRRICTTCDRNMKLGYGYRSRHCATCEVFLAEREWRRIKTNTAFDKISREGRNASLIPAIPHTKRGQPRCRECVEWKPDRLMMDENTRTKQIVPRCNMSFLPKEEMELYYTWSPLRKQLTFDCIRVGLLK